jgi:GntR family transcriptional regulator / MocR family aminotransferase
VTKNISSFELTLRKRPQQLKLTRWLYEELRRAILDRRLPPGTRLPATRDFARQYAISRGTAVAAFEQLQAEGFLTGQIGAGTWVNEQLPEHLLGPRTVKASVKKSSDPLAESAFSFPPRPFRSYIPALAEFPIDIWARVAGHRLRRASASLLTGFDPRGYAPLREAIAGYLGSKRGVRCSPDQVIIVSGAQQALDLLARFLVKPGDAVWIEDPGYFGAEVAFRNAGAEIILVPLDEEGLSITKGKHLCTRAKAAYLTPAHQFPLGITMSLQRRLALLDWAREVGGFLIEDDYDSEFRFEGLPVPALQGLDQAGNVILIGSFNKVMFPSLRLGYLILPTSLIDPFLEFRYTGDLHPSGLDQAILCDFIVEGHLGRHIRRMRNLYGGRLLALQESAKKYLDGVIEIKPIQAGLATSALLLNGMTSREAEDAAIKRGIEAMALDRFTLGSTPIHGLHMGFAAFDEGEIRRGIIALARAFK